MKTKIIKSEEQEKKLCIGDTVKTHFGGMSGKPSYLLIVFEPAEGNNSSGYRYLNLESMCLSRLFRNLDNLLDKYELVSSELTIID